MRSARTRSLPSPPGARLTPGPSLGAGSNPNPNPCSLPPQFLCTVIAILLHYVYMSTFAWTFVEGLHVYRMLTEVRNIDAGPMRFYYVVGWGIPAIITGEDWRSRPAGGAPGWEPTTAWGAPVTLPTQEPTAGKPTVLGPGGRALWPPWVPQTPSVTGPWQRRPSPPLRLCT